MIDVSEVLEEFAQTVTKKVVSITTADFEQNVNVTATQIRAVVQPADPQKLTNSTLDWSMKHYQIHTTDMLAVGNVIEYKGADFKVVIVSDFDDYGYTMAIAQETKQPLLRAL